MGLAGPLKPALSGRSLGTEACPALLPRGLQNEGLCAGRAAGLGVGTPAKIPVFPPNLGSAWVKTLTQLPLILKSRDPLGDRQQSTNLPC